MADDAPGDAPGVVEFGASGVQYRIDRHLMAGLIRAMDWFDNGLQNVLAAKGFKPLHRWVHVDRIVADFSGGHRGPHFRRRLC